MRLVESSSRGAVERDAALVLLAQRAVLTRMVCTEAQQHLRQSTRRSVEALGFLLGWIGNRYSPPSREPEAADGLAEMVVPKGCELLMEEIRAGTEVVEAFAMLMTADNSLQLEGDEAKLRARLESYWSRHPEPCAGPWLLN